MSGLAEILIKEGFSISGSDIHTSDIIKHLEDKGAKVYLSQTADNITDDIDLVVYTAAINFDTNEEYKEAIRRNIPVMKRATLLGQMMHNYQNAIAVSDRSDSDRLDGRIRRQSSPSDERRSFLKILAFRDSKKEEECIRCSWNEVIKR